MELFGINFGKKEPKASEEVIDIDDVDGIVDPEEEPLQESFTYEPKIPTVNTIPDAMIQRYQIKGVIKLFLSVVAAIAVLFVLLYLGANLILNAQDGQIKKLNTERDSLQSEMQVLQPYEAYKGEVDNKLKVMSEATLNDINYGVVYQDLLDAADATDVQLGNVLVAQFANLDGSEVGSCISPDPFNPTQGATGCISLTGGANDQESLIRFLDLLENSERKGFSLPSISSFSYSDNAAEGAKATSFQASIFFTGTFYSNKYAELKITVDELLANKKAGTDTVTEEGTDGLTTDMLIQIASNSFQAVNLSPDEETLTNASVIVSGVCETGEVDMDVLGGYLESLGSPDVATDTQIFLETVKGSC